MVRPYITISTMETQPTTTPLPSPPIPPFEPGSVSRQTSALQNAKKRLKPIPKQALPDSTTSVEPSEQPQIRPPSALSRDAVETTRRMDEIIASLALSRSPVQENNQAESVLQSKTALKLPQIFSAEECRSLIDATESLGYGDALVNIGYGRQILETEIRNSSRCMVDSTALACCIFDRISQWLPPTWRGRRLEGLNERMRFLRYYPGQYFRPHMDGTYTRPYDGGSQSGDRSFLTLLLYLNDDYTGGATTFLVDKVDPNTQGGLKLHEVPVPPETGMVLVHQHDIMHESPTLEAGVKYVIRTDVMYTSRN